MRMLLTRFAAFAKRHWTKLVGALLALLALGGLAKTLRDRNEAKLDAAARSRIAENERRISELRALRAEALGRMTARTDRIRVLDTRIAAAQREVVEAHQRTEGLSDDEVVQRFRSLGYH